MTETRTRDQERNGWTPVLNGDTYCSPRCGAKCTKADYDLCVTRANRLCKLLGEGWETRVWENLGWHYEVVFDLGTDRPGPLGPGQIKLHPSTHKGKTTYLCYFNSAAGQVMGESHEDPLEALIIAVRRVEAKRDVYSNDLSLVRAKTRNLVLRLLS